MWIQPTPKDFDFKEFESSLSEVAFTKITAFLYILLCNHPPPPPLVPNILPPAGQLSSANYCTWISNL